VIIVDGKILEFLKKYYMYIAVGLFAIVSLLLSIDTNETESSDYTPTFASENLIETYIYIDIRGSVLNPGVYKVLDGTRLFQLISLAGGLTMEANEQVINQSQLLEDEMFIYVPNLEENVDSIGDAGEINNVSEDEKIDINKSSKSELETLPGIGPSTAQNIIDYRTEIEEFISIEDIMKVPGIGEVTFNEIKDLIIT